jgi:hypothetical protein
LRNAHPRYDVSIGRPPPCCPGLGVRLLNRKRIAEKGNLQPDVVPMVRIPPNARERNQWVIKQALDTGVYGLVLPHLSTVEDAQAAVAAAWYPQVPGVQDLHRPGSAVGAIASPPDTGA